MHSICLRTQKVFLLERTHICHYLDKVLYLKFLRFLFRFTGKDDEVNLLGDGTEKPEFGEWSWLSPEQVLDGVGSTFP